MSRWTDAEDATLRERWGRLSVPELARQLPRHTHNAIRSRASILRITAGAKPPGRGPDEWFNPLAAPPVSAERLALLDLVDTCADLIARLEPLPKTQALIAGKLGQSLKAARQVLATTN